MSPHPDPEEKRIQQEYQERGTNPMFRTLYAPYSPFTIFHQARLELLIGNALRDMEMLPLREYSILDIGCGSGGHLLRFLLNGALPKNLHGIDVIPERIWTAQQQHSEITFHVGNANAIPYSDECFDLVTQFTVFSSILDVKLQQQIAEEMVRVLRVNGVVLWYDSRAQGSNPALTSFNLKQVKELFPTLDVMTCSTAKLRFGLSRHLVPYTWEVVSFLERFPVLCEMYFIVMQKHTPHSSK
jgi:ubiquinone/menaquinone biosynthesis C-methylase UbiE